MMKLLAIESSAPIGSVALLDREEVVIEQPLPSSNGRASGVFDVLQSVMDATGWQWDDIACYAAGRGPGRYSGMRVALTTAQALALPGNTTVCAIQSGAALAHAIAADHPDTHTIVVAGDARRGQVWNGVFARTADGLIMTRDWSLALPTDAFMPDGPGVVGVSSEWTRLAPMLSSHDRWIQEDVSPTAGWIGRLAFQSLQRGLPVEPCRPIYLHPAVDPSFKPRG